MQKYLALVTILILSGGCSAEVNVGNSSQTKAEFERTVVDGVDPDDAAAKVSAVCDGGIEKQDGATQDCVIKVGAETSNVHITLADTGKRFDLEFEPYVTADELAASTTSVFAEQDVVLDSVDCPGELSGVVGEKIECDLTSGDQSGTAVVKVTSVDGLRVNLSFKLLQ